MLNVGPMIPLSQQLARAVVSALDKATIVVPNDLRIEVVAATDPKFGDYQCNIAMALAKALRTNPRAVATSIIENLDTQGLATPEIAGAGFLNFRIANDHLASALGIMSADARLGVPASSEPRRVVIDFSSPNVAKPMHIGHIRSTLLGDCLARIARFIGHDVITDNHVGDWGTQFGKVIHGWKTLLDRKALELNAVGELVRLYRTVNAAADADPDVENVCRAELVKLQQGDPENTAIWQECIALSRREFERVYEALGVTFDHWLGESHYNDRLAPLVDQLQKAGIAVESDGALCVFFQDNPQLADKPCLVRKRDGGFLYATTDLATIDFRVSEWKADAIWYVVGAPQQLHLAQVFATAKRMGHTVEMVHISFGSILGEDRKLMKTRSGDNVALLDVLSEARTRAATQIGERLAELPPDQREQIADIIGLGAVKYAELSQYRMTDYVFSWDKMLALQGNTAPYLQNACVRIRSIFRKAAAEGIGMDNIRTATITIGHDAERLLARHIVLYPETVPQILDGFRPNILTNYLYELANIFHSFYEACPVLKATEAERSSRLALCRLTESVLTHGLSLLGIAAPGRM